MPTRKEADAAAQTDEIACKPPSRAVAPCPERRAPQGKARTRSVRQLRRSRLDPRDIGVARLRKAGTVIRVGLVEVREHRVLVSLIAHVAEVPTECGDQIGFVLLR